MKRMLVNATQSEELRVAIVDGQKLIDLDIETPSREQKKSNIYKGKVTRVEPSLEAAFVDYGAERHGFLPLKEISRNYFLTEFVPGSGQRPNIKEAIKEGQELVVQVEKEERGNKGAALTTFVSLAGRFLVLMPNNPRAGGVSRRIEGDERNEIREILSQLDIPSGMGVIVRTAGVGRSQEELKWDMDYLIHLWEAIETASKEKPAPFLIYQESNVIIRTLRDLMRNDIGEILIDNKKLYEEAQDFITQVMPHNLSKLKHYQHNVPLFTKYQIESQIDSAYNRQVRLPSGGSIVIDHTEALVSIDINSSRATKGADIEETALNTNLEAADEIARQLRLRDLGGLIVIDFIDMLQTRNQREVESRLREALKMDRARVQVGRISRFGLLEMSRQRLRASLGESIQITCPRCNGHGHIRGTESLSLSILRILEEEAMKENTSKIIAQLPVKAATFLLNEKREMIHAIENRQNVAIILVPNANLETPNFELKRIRENELNEETEQASYKMELVDSGEEDYQPEASKPQDESAAVNTITPPAPPVTPRSVSSRQRPADGAEEGLLKRLWSSLFGDKLGKPGSKPAQSRSTKPRSGGNRRSSNGGRRTNGRNRRGGTNQSRNRRAQDQARGQQAGQQAKSAQQRGEQQKNRPAQANGNRQDNRRSQNRNTRSQAGNDNRAQDNRKTGRGQQGQGRGAAGSQQNRPRNEQRTDNRTQTEQSTPREAGRGARNGGEARNERGRPQRTRANQKRRNENTASETARQDNGAPAAVEPQARRSNGTTGKGPAANRTQETTAAASRPAGDKTSPGKPGRTEQTAASAPEAKKRPAADRKPPRQQPGNKQNTMAEKEPAQKPAAAQTGFRSAAAGTQEQDQATRKQQAADTPKPAPVTPGFRPATGSKNPPQSTGSDTPRKGPGHNTTAGETSANDKAANTTGSHTKGEQPGGGRPRTEQRHNDEQRPAQQQAGARNEKPAVQEQAVAAAGQGTRAAVPGFRSALSDTKEDSIKKDS